MRPYTTFERTTRYTAVGALCAASHNIIMILGGWYGGHYVPLSFLSFGLVTPLGYCLHSNFTFKTPMSFNNFFRFAFGLAAGFPAYFVVMATLCSGLDIAVAWAAPITTITLYLWNYAWVHWALHAERPSADRHGAP